MKKADFVFIIILWSYRYFIFNYIFHFIYFLLFFALSRPKPKRYMPNSKSPSSLQKSVLEASMRLGKVHMLRAMAALIPTTDNCSF